MIQICCTILYNAHKLTGQFPVPTADVKYCWSCIELLALVSTEGLLLFTSDGIIEGFEALL